MTDQYKSTAGGWDEIPWKIKLAQEAYAAICAKVNIVPGLHLVDFGGGTGLLTLKFKAEVSRITVVDTSEAMLAVLREKIETQKLANIEIVNQALSKATLPAESCDLIISMLTLHHIENIPALFYKFHDMLALNGNIALIDLAREEGDFHPQAADYVHDGFEPEALAAPLEKAGFRNIDVETFTSITRETESGETKTFPLLLATAAK